MRGIHAVGFRPADTVFRMGQAPGQTLTSSQRMAIISKIKDAEAKLPKTDDLWRLSVNEPEKFRARVGAADVDRFLAAADEQALNYKTAKEVKERLSSNISEFWRYRPGDKEAVDRWVAAVNVMSEIERKPIRKPGEVPTVPPLPAPPGGRIPTQRQEERVETMAPESKVLGIPTTYLIVGGGTLLAVGLVTFLARSR